MFLWSYFIFPLIPVFFFPQSDMYYTTIPDTEHVHLLLFARYIRLLPLLRYIPFHTYSAICPLFFLSAVMHLYATSFHLLRCCWHSFFHFFFLEVPSQYLLQQWPIFPTGIIKTSSRYLYTYTNLLPSSSPSHLSPNSPWSFSPQRLFFSHRVSPLWCKHFVLGAEKAVQTDGG